MVAHGRWRFAGGLESVSVGNGDLWLIKLWG
jgi:hypothetical protein